MHYCLLAEKLFWLIVLLIEPATIIISPLNLASFQHFATWFEDEVVAFPNTRLNYDRYFMTNANASNALSVRIQCQRSRASHLRCASSRAFFSFLHHSSLRSRSDPEPDPFFLFPHIFMPIFFHPPLSLLPCFGLASDMLL